MVAVKAFKEPEYYPGSSKFKVGMETTWYAYFCTVFDSCKDEVCRSSNLNGLWEFCCSCANFDPFP